MTLLTRLAALEARRSPPIMAVAFQVNGATRVAWHGRLMDADLFLARYPDAQLRTVVLDDWPAEHWGVPDP